MSQSPQNHNAKAKQILMCPIGLSAIMIRVLLAQPLLRTAFCKKLKGLNL